MHVFLLSEDNFLICKRRVRKKRKRKRLTSPHAKTFGVHKTSLSAFIFTYSVAFIRIRSHFRKLSFAGKLCTRSESEQNTLTYRLFCLLNEPLILNKDSSDQRIRSKNVLSLSATALKFVQNSFLNSGLFP